MKYWNGQFLQKWNEGGTVRQIQRPRQWILENLVAEDHTLSAGFIKYPYEIHTPHVIISGKKVKWFGGGNGASQEYWLEADNALDSLDLATQIEKFFQSGKSAKEIYDSF